jgi:hypothetical protein
MKIPPKSSCTNFQSLCKFKSLIFYSKRNFFQLPTQSAQQPRRLLSLSAHLAQPAFLPLPALKQGTPPPPALRSPPATPRLHPAMEALPRAPHHIPCLFHLPPPLIYRVNRQLRVSHFIPINASHSSALTTGRPLNLYKKGEPRHPPPHLSRSPSPLCTLEHCSHQVLPPHLFTGIARSSRRLSILGESLNRTPVISSSFLCSHGKPPWPGAAARLSSVEARATIHCGVHNELVDQRFPLSP